MNFSALPEHVAKMDHLGANPQKSARALLRGDSGLT
jgi:hypothetical protein